MPHTATALDGESFDSAAVDPGASWTHIFSKPGEYTYRCTLHPSMRATIVVR
jgi:plastocyanin